MIRICYLLGGFTVNGGIGRVTSILANRLCKSGDYAIHALSFYDTHCPDLYNIEPEIIRNNLFDEPLTMQAAILKGGIRKLRRYIDRNSIDILIACGALYYPISILACKGKKTKCICWEHSNVMNARDHSYQMLCRGFGARNADRVVALTRHDRQSFVSRYGIQNASQIYNPVDETAMSHVREYDADSTKILSVGRLSYQKNFELLVEIAAAVLPAHPEWTWDIYGEGELRSMLEDKISKMGLQGRLTLRGQVDNLYDPYNDYSMLVMTSRYEGFPMTLLEGMAFGLPLLSFDVLTGPGEIISDGGNGYLVEPFLSEKMASRIEGLMNDRELRRRLSAQSRQDRERFRLGSIVAEWDDLFRSMLRNRDPEGR